MPISRYAMNYGLILGVYSSIIFFLRILSQRFVWLASVYLLLLIFTFFVAHKIGKSFIFAYEEAEETSLSRMKYIFFGMLLFFFGGMIDGAVQYIYYQYINPLYISQQFALGKEMLLKYTENPQLKEIYEFAEPPSAVRFVIQIIEYEFLFGGIVFSFFSLFDIRRKRKISYNEDEDKDD